jgi:hypothetical protein
MTISARGTSRPARAEYKDRPPEVNTLLSLEEVNENLNKNPRAPKARTTVHDIFVDGATVPSANLCSAVTTPPLATKEFRATHRAEV